MKPRGQPLKAQASTIRHLRWYIGGLLFLSTVINYIDRQVLGILAPGSPAQVIFSMVILEGSRFIFDLAVSAIPRT